MHSPLHRYSYVWRGISQLGHFLSSMDPHHPCLYLNCSQHFDLYREQLHIDAMRGFYIDEPLRSGGGGPY